MLGSNLSRRLASITLLSFSPVGAYILLFGRHEALGGVAANERGFEPGLFDHKRQLLNCFAALVAA